MIHHLQIIKPTGDIGRWAPWAPTAKTVSINSTRLKTEAAESLCMQAASCELGEISPAMVHLFTCTKTTSCGARTKKKPDGENVQVRDGNTKTFLKSCHFGISISRYPMHLPCVSSLVIVALEIEFADKSCKEVLLPFPTDTTAT